MSAYMCSERTLTALARYAVDRCPEAIPLADKASESRSRTIARVFSMLVSENLASLAARYPGEEDRREQCGYFDSYQLHGGTPPVSPITIVKLCHHYAYQSCEHAGWKTSQARKLIDAIEADAAHQIYKANGYDAAPWGL